MAAAVLVQFCDRSLIERSSAVLKAGVLGPSQVLAKFFDG